MLLSQTASLIPQDNIEMLIIDNEHAHATISLFGGHILSFIPKHDGVQRLWLSKNARLDGKHPIRGGIPICWPWFGPHKTQSELGSHGYVRNQAWHVADCTEKDGNTIVCLKPATTQGQGFVGQTHLSLIITVGREMRIQLLTENIGDQPFTFTGALHSYFHVDDIDKCRLNGLTGEYEDKLQAYKRLDSPSPYSIHGETDRVHLVTPAELTIECNSHTTHIHSRGHDSIVVWNPWSEKSHNMQDMEDDGYRKMLCVETAVTRNETVLPGHKHMLEQVIS
ncbi:D-hexose-6-phosphate mutarotase [uncultured Paraglaciecola sp.]|uniref:D-hexose-6-phosphate mutarotase n=1 Tax=uncultured Paraglaciecola sp. TaxID=1765024 RepID=UPI0030D98968|tara:strand:+ start:2972 stop:3811 length:840 start_codon:yes stop_codon:yes gene_type:complete